MSGKLSSPIAVFRGASRATRAGWLGFVLILLLASWLRFETIGSRPLWADEMFSSKVALGSRSVSDVWQAASADHAANPPVHLLSAWVSVGISKSRTGFRMPSALAGLTALALLMVVGIRLFDRPTGLTAGALMAISVYQINYAQDGRPYALLLAFTIAQALSLILYLQSPRRRYLVCFTLVGALGLYTHHLAAVTQVSLGLFVLFWWWQHARANTRGDHLAGEDHRFGFGNVFAIGVAYLAMFILFVPQLFHVLEFLGSPNLGAQSTLWPSPRLFHELFARWGAGRGWIAWGYDAAFLAGGGLLLWKGPRLAWILIPWFLGPFLLFSTVPFDKFFDIRFLIQAYPVFIILVAHALVEAARLGARTLVDMAGGRLPMFSATAVVAIALMGVFATPNLRAYGAFREIPIRCSDYFLQPSILYAHDRFCRDHLILSSVVPTDRFMIRSVGAGPEEPDEEARTPDG